MNDVFSPPSGSPLLGHSPASLPASCYHDEPRFRRELSHIWGRNWIYAGRINDLPALTLRRVSIAGQNLILLKDMAGTVTAFHNTCRHRGAELCGAAERPLKAKLITCPYHDWSYDLDGRLARTPFASPAADFDRAAHGLFPVAARQWNGCIFLCLADDPPDFAAASDPGASALDNWPMQALVTGHALVKEMACNWKILWENYNECLHCPGIHPALCEMVPVYRQGIMAAEEAADWHPDGGFTGTALKPGTRSWTMDGAPCGPEFPGLDERQRGLGQLFVTLLPTMYLVAHVDYVRTVSFSPLGPERTEVRAEWLFLPETLRAPGFDLARVVDFARTVILEDGAACEMNQRGLRSDRFAHGTLMPQEFDVHRFQNWVRAAMGDQP